MMRSTWEPGNGRSALESTSNFSFLPFYWLMARDHKRPQLEQLLKLIQGENPSTQPSLKKTPPFYKPCGNH